MSAEFQSTATTESEPTSTLAVVPVWLLILMLVVVYWGAVFFDKHGGWFNPKVYGPYASIAELDRYQPRQSEDMKEDDLAAVLSYIRQAWGNKASRVKVEQVKAVKAEVGKRGPSTPEELMKVPAN